MIVIDHLDEDSPIRKSPEVTRPAPEPAAASETRPLIPNSYANTTPASPPREPPPAYYQSTSGPASREGYYSHRSHSHSSSRWRPDHATRRFLQAFAIAVLIYLVGAALLGSWSFSRHRPILNSPSGDWPFVPRSNFSIYDNVHCVAADEWTIIPGGRHGVGLGQNSTVLATPFQLPLQPDVDLFLVASLGIGGHLNIIEDEDLADFAEVRISASYYNKPDRLEAILNSSICHFTLAGMSQGIEFAVDPAAKQDLPGLLHLDVVLALPAGRAHRLAIPQLVIRMPHMTVDIGWLAQDYFFNKLEVLGRDGDISVGSVAGSEIIIKACNSPIHGFFEVSRILDLYTTNSRISADVVALHGAENEANGHNTPTDVMVQTSNSPLQVDFTLKSTTLSGTGGSYRVVARTTEARLDIGYLQTPVDSILSMVGATTNAPALVVLDAAFEGELEVSTSKAGYIDLMSVTETDPSGRNRRRRMVFDRKTNRQRVEGSLLWDSKTRFQQIGHVSVTGDEEIRIQV